MEVIRVGFSDYMKRINCNGNISLQNEDDYEQYKGMICV